MYLQEEALSPNFKVRRVSQKRDNSKEIGRGGHEETKRKERGSGGRNGMSHG